MIANNLDWRIDISIQINQRKTMNKQTEQDQPSLIKTSSSSPSTTKVQTNQSSSRAAYIQQQNTHQFILTEFKQKYDQLKDQFQAKKKEADLLLYEKKKLQIELLNRNVEYYERQLVRLRSEVQKYQLQNEQNKHKFFVAQNSRKDLQATAKVKQEELKQTLKQLEREKIAVVQLRHQLAEKDKTFTTVIASLEQANHDISEKYDQSYAKLNKTENDLKVKGVEMEQAKREVTQKTKEIETKQEEHAKIIERLELEEYRLKNRNEDLEEELKQLQLKEDSEIKKLTLQVKELEEKRTSESLLLEHKNEATDQIKHIRIKQIQVAHLEEQNRQLQHQLKEKATLVSTFEDKLKESIIKHQQYIHDSHQGHTEAVNKQKIVEQHLENRVLELEKQLELLKLNPRTDSPPKSKNDFQTMLKNQIEQNARLKLQLSLKIDEIYNLKHCIEEQRLKQGLLQNEIDILNKKQKSLQKNSKIDFEIELQNLKNEIDTLRRKQEVTQTKLNIKLKQVKDKDAFITSVIIGRSKQQDVPFVLAELQRIFEAEYVNKLAEATLKIADLQAKLQHK